MATLAFNVLIELYVKHLKLEIWSSLFIIDRPASKVYILA